MKTFLLLITVASLNASSSPAQKPPFWAKRAATEIKQKSVGKFLPMLETFDSWDSIHNVWNNSANFSYQYTALGLISERLQMDMHFNEKYKEVFTYDHNGNKTEMVYYLKDTLLNNWNPSYRNVIQYYKPGLESLNQLEVWNKNKNQWDISSRAKKEYTEWNDISLSTYEQVIDSDTILSVGEKTDYVYDLNNKKIKETFIKYDTDTKTWDSVLSFYSLYNSKGSIAQQEIDLYNLQTNVWQKLKKQTYTYNQQDTLIQVGTYQYNPQNNSWENKELYDQIKWIEWTGDANDEDNILSYVYKNWNTSTNLYDTSKTYYKNITDAFGSNTITILRYKSGMLLPEQQFTTVVDQNKNRTYFQIQTGQNEEWILTYEEKTDFTYNTDSGIVERIDWVFNFNINALEKQTRTQYKNFLTLGIEKENALNFNIYPNPSNTGMVSINVKMEQASYLTIRVIDLKGSLVSTKTKSLNKGLNTIELDGLQHGMYLVELNTEFGVARTKLAVN